MTTPQSVLVLGLGELGTAVLNALCSHPLLPTSSTTLTLLVRPSTLSAPNQAQKALLDAFRARGVILQPGDIVNSSTAELTALFAPHDVVIGCTGMAAPAGTQVKQARAALAAGAPRYVPWQFGVDYDAIGAASAQDLFTEQLEVRGLLRAQERTRWCVVSTGIFMSFAFWEGFGVVGEKGEVVRALGSWENGLTVTAVEDIGRMVAEVVFAEGAWPVEERGSGIVFIAGDTLKYKEFAEVVGRVTGKEVRKELWTVEKLEQDVTEEPDNGMRKYRAVFAKGVGVAWDKGKTLNARLGIELQTAEQWARESWNQS
ncbi:NmrA family protein [Lineolata rhizophorae]|uniref:NmrA family protein n=1 Tax=Lineolata rhizophorae TaxID=578093 RepID=A0A6A6NYK1_9PEZI|nr:NmrA family protein [Lineolata rhizophorae]